MSTYINAVILCRKFKLSQGSLICLIGVIFCISTAGIILACLQCGGMCVFVTLINFPQLAF